MKTTYNFDFKQIKSLSEFYTVFANEMGCASYFGRNLDALYDVLSEVPLPCHINLKFMNESQKSKFARLISVFEHVAEQYFDFEFSVEMETE